VRQLRDVHACVAVLPIDDEPEGDFVVAAPAVDEVARLARLNERALERRLPWLQVLPFDGRIIVAGPLFLPGESACRACFVLRRGACSGYEEDFDLVEREALKVVAPAPLIAIGAGIAAQIAVRWLATRDPTLPGRFYALDVGVVLRLSHAQVLRVPRCPACGTPQRAVPSPWFEETP
jgi:bacteriocin biosynthesis cyclodehydratase domain-containing protein